MVYDDRYHLHIGYYENGHDIEAIALKRLNEDIWDIFFDFEFYGFQVPTEKSERLEYFGIKIFSIENEELDYFDGARKFEQWLLTNNLL
ncbi:DUF3986 family protein [Metabacillus malikii]|uniref:DUF3986 family protein n=1 Tax=Metabacillus malikii TaxID=1504265 RepID=A0ABT9Z9W5_9BACI|nr:DUF3986 family protein [Metabacillus malikii]MDQ0229037.1 hypothetical protein [Metabacillus malikii]